MAKTLPTLSFDKELTDKQKSAFAEADKQVKAEKLIGGTAPRQARTNNEAEKASERAAIEKAKAKQLAKNAGQAFTERKRTTAKNIVQNAGQKLAGKQTAEKQDSPLVNQGKKAVERVTGRARDKLTDEQIALGLVTKDPALSLNSGAGIIGRQAERKARFDQAAKATELESERQKQVIEAQRQANEEYKKRFLEPIETAKKDADDAAKAYQDALNMWVAASRGGSSKDEVDELWKQAEGWKFYAMTKAQEYTRIHKQAQEEAEAWEEARAEAARQAAARRAKLEYDLEQAQMRQAETGRQLAPMLVREAGERLRQTGPETYGFGGYAEMPAARRTADIIRAAAYGNLAGYANAVGMLDPYAEAVSQDEGSILAGNYRVPQMRTAGQVHMQSLARQWDELGRTSLERAKADLSTGGQVAVEIGVAALQMLGDIAITQGRGTLYAMTVRAGGGYAMEAARDGASQNEQFVYGLAGGAVEAATEKIFAVAPLFNKVFGKPIVKTDFADSVIRTLTRTAKSPTGKAIVDRTAHGLLAMTSEGAEEVLADFMEPVIRKATYDRDGKIKFDWQQMLHDGIIGAALGGLGVPGIIARSGQVRSGYELDEALDRYQAAIIEHGILSDEARQASMNVWRMTGKLSTQDVAKAVSERLAADPEAAAKEPGVRYWLAKGRETERVPAEAAEPVMPEAETQRVEDEEAAPAEAAAPAVGEAAPPATDVAPSPLRRGGLEEDVPAPVLPGMDELRAQEAERAPAEPERPAPSVGEADSSPFAQGEPYVRAERDEVPAPVLPGVEELRTQEAERAPAEAERPAPSVGEADSSPFAQGEPYAGAEREEVPAPVLPGMEELSGGSRAAAGDVLRLQSGAEFEIIATDAEDVTLDATDEAGRHGHISWGNLAKMQDAGQITITRSGENGTLPDRGRYGEPGGRAGGQTEGLRPGGELGQTAAERVRAADRGRALSTDNGQRAPLVSGREIGLRNGSDTKAARVIPEHRWKDSGHSALFEEIRAAGYEPIPFTGTVYVETAGRRAAVDGFRFERNGRRYLGVKMDSNRFSPRQIARHELAHEEYVRQPLMVRAVWDRLTADGDESFYNLLEDYVQGLHSMYGEELERYMEEIFCDAQAGISRRYAPMNEELRGRISETAGQVRQEYADATEGRGPPEGKAGERYSVSEDEETVSYRYVSKGENPISEYAGYAMFADDEGMVSSGIYGEDAYTVSHDELTSIDDLKDTIAAAWDKTVENGNEPASLWNLAELPGEEVAELFDPADIVDSAEAWDEPDLISWAFEYGVFDDVPNGVKTQDGAVVWNADVIEKKKNAGERYSASEDEEVPTPKAEVHEAMEQLARERDGDIARAADEKRQAAAFRLKTPTLKNKIRETKEEIKALERVLARDGLTESQKRGLEARRANLRAMETELKRRTDEEDEAQRELKERREAEEKERKEREKRERPAKKARRKAEVLGLPADYADPLNDDSKGKGSAEEAAKAAEAAEKAENKGKKKTVKPQRAAAETANKLIKLFGVEQEDRAEVKTHIMDALVRFAKRGRMPVEELRALENYLFTLGTVEDEARYPEAEELRRQMRRRRIHVNAELKKEWGDDWGAFTKRALAAGFYITDDPTAIRPDMLNHELAKEFPGFFDEGETDQYAFMEKLMSIAEEGQAERQSMEEFLHTLRDTDGQGAVEWVRETEAKVRQILRKFAADFKMEAAADAYWTRQLWQQEKRHQRDIKARDRHEESRARELAREQIAKDRAKRAEDRRAATQWRQEQQERKAVFNMIQQAAKMSRRVNLGTISEMEAAIGDADLDAIRLIKPAERTAEQKVRMEIAEARAALAEAIVGIDTMARRLSNQGIENREKLAEDYGRLMAEKGENFIPIKGIEQRIAQLNQKQINDMKIEDVRELAKTLSEMINQVETGDKLLSEMRDRDLKTVTERAAREIRETKGRRSKRGKKSVPFMEELLQINQLDPGRIMSMLGGWRDSGTWEDFRRVFERATDRYMKFRGEANRLYSSFSDKAFSEYGIDEDKKGAVDYDARKKWLEKSYGRKADWQKVEVKYYDPEGVVEQMEKGELPISTTTIEVTPMMRVALYLHAQNNSNLNHIATGGIVLPDKDLYRKGKAKKAYEAGSNRRLRITPESMKTLAEDVEKNHPMEHAFAQLMLKFTDGQSKDAINRVSMLIDGWERAAVKNYWPIESAKDFVGGDAASWGDYASLQNIGSIANERVPEAGNPILLLDANDTFERQKETVAKYAGYAIPMRDLAGVLMQNFHKGAAYTGSVRDLIASKWGDEMIEYLENIQKDLSFKTAAKKIKFLNKLRGNLSGAWLLGNLSVFVSQSSAYITALPYLDMKALGHGMKFWNKVDTDLISKYTGVYDYREASGYSPEAMDWLKSNNPTARFVGKHKKANLAEVGDSFWIRRLWAACEYQINKDTDLAYFAPIEEYYGAVAELFRKVVFHTQYNSSTFQRSALLRDERDIMRLLTMFKTDAFQHYGMVYEALGRLGRARQELSEARTDEEKAEARRNFSDKKKNLARNLTAVVMSEAVWSGIKGGFKVLRGSAGAFATGAGAVTVGSFAAGTVALTMESLAGSVFLGEEVFQYLLALISKLFPGDDDEDDKKAAGLLKRDYYGFDLNVVGEITDYAEDWLSLAAAIGSAGADWKKQAKGVATSTLEFTGMPVGTVTRSLENILRMAYPKGRYKLDNFWKPLDKTALAKVPESARPAAISVLFGNRVEISDGAAEELARLYGDYGGDVLPTKLPTSISVDGEDVKLDVDKLNKYKDAWGKAFGGQLEELIKSPEYTATDDAGRVKLIKALYDYAGQLAKQEAVGAEPDKWVLQSRDLTTGGAVTLPEILAYKQSGGKLDTLTKYLDEGMSVEGAITAAGVLGELEPEDGKSQVSNGQKLMALGTELGDQKDKNAAAHKILSSESAVAKYDEAMKAGLTTYEYGACLSAIGGVKPHEGRQEANQWQKVMALDNALQDQKDVQTAAKILVLDGSTAEEYDAAIKAGFSSYEYAEMQDGFTTVEPHEGRKEASYDQKLDVIVKTISPHRQVEAAKAITESEEGKANLDKVIDAGISLSTYADYQEALNVTYAHDDVDENGEKVKDSRKKHMFEYVSGLPLTAQQKSMLIGTKYAESTVEKERLW